VSEEAAVAEAAPGISIAGHPRAPGAIRRARARTALAAFAVVLLLCLHKGLGGQLAVVRALEAGVAGFLVAWMIAVAVWRQIVLAEIKAVHDQRKARRRELIAAAEARRAAAS
jgi:hypothetical protein